MIAQIVQKLFGPMPAGSEGVITPPQAASANSQNADFAAEMDVFATLPNGAPVIALQQSKIGVQDGQSLEADEALLAGLIAAQGNLVAPVAAPIARQGEAFLAVPVTRPSAVALLDSAKDFALNGPQVTGIVEQTFVLTEFDLSQVDAPQTEPKPQLAGIDVAGKGELRPVLGPQMGESHSNVIQTAQLGAEVLALEPDPQAFTTTTATPVNVDQANSKDVPRAQAPVANGLAQPLAESDLGVKVVTAPPQPVRIAQAALEPSLGAGVTNAANIPPPSPVQMSFQASFLQIQAVQAGKTDSAIKLVQTSVSDSVKDDSDGRNSDPLTSFAGAGRIDNTVSAPITPSQNVVNFSNSQSEQVAALGVEALAHSSLTEGSSPLGPIGEGRSGGALSIGATAPVASSASFGAANMPSAALSAQILPLAREAQNGGVDLTLSPAELGQLRFEMRQVGDQMQILLSAERQETLDLLRRHIDALRSDFAEAGFSGASLSFGSWSQGREQSSPPQFLPEYQDITAQNAPVPSVISAPSPIWPQKQDAGRGLNLRL
jgi:hypothetical protein